MMWVRWISANAQTKEKVIIEQLSTFFVYDLTKGKVFSSGIEGLEPKDYSLLFFERLINYES